ncbi:205 kDa microtubule-associated protein [Musca domestica]|uniref:205 kDa microtubule-associated protein n=1 Tax=Musca domestica TaxID=7370 RepID=A0A1I8N770_MUSDO|nr:205 kDa microtubule-associated protein [Musca domestica]XP_005176116.1 205 kDa microtubule-associated protein [Musca domestica]XP_011295012.1 205 kDa microtubule-associated protein [Musca domestica]XP_011295015.1 205 kDa microtubule-associated protein [Musca domestica]
MEDHEIMDQLLEHRQQNFVIDNMNAVAGCGGIGVGDVSSGGEILGVKYDEQLQAEEHDVGDDDELKYVKEVQQSEKQQTGGKDFGDYNSGNELAENEEATHKYKIGHGDVAVDMKDEKEIANVVSTFTTSTNSNDENNGISNTEELQQQIMENINNNPLDINSALGFEKSDVEIEEMKKNYLNGGDEEDISSLASNGTSSLSENVAQHFGSETENVKESLLPDDVQTKDISTPLYDMDIPLEPNVNVEATHCQLNPEAKEFVPNFGSNPASPLSPHPNDIQSSNLDGVDFFGQAPSAVPRRILDDDDFVAHSPRKGRCNDMDVISLPAEQEFDEEADRRPHELTQDEVVLSDNNVPYDIPNNEVVSSDPILQLAEDQGPETSVDPDDDTPKEEQFEKISFVENDVMKQSIYLANDEPIEDVLNSVQPIPTEIDSVNNSFMDDFTGNDIVGEKEQLQTEEKEHISNSPSTEEMHVELENALPSNGEAFENLMPEEDLNNYESKDTLENVEKGKLPSSPELIHDVEQTLETLDENIEQKYAEVSDGLVQGDVEAASNALHVDEKHLMEETKETPINTVEEKCCLEEQMDKMSINAVQENSGLEEQMDKVSLNADGESFQRDDTQSSGHADENINDEHKTLSNLEDDKTHQLPEEPIDKVNVDVLTVSSEINGVETLETENKFENSSLIGVGELQSQNENNINVDTSDINNMSNESAPMSPVEPLNSPISSDNYQQKYEPEEPTPDNDQCIEITSNQLQVDHLSEEGLKEIPCVENVEQAPQENVILQENSELDVTVNSATMDSINNALDITNEAAGAVSPQNETADSMLEHTVDHESLVHDNSTAFNTHDDSEKDLSGVHVQSELITEQILEPVGSQAINQCEIITFEASEDQTNVESVPKEEPELSNEEVVIKQVATVEGASEEKPQLKSSNEEAINQVAPELKSTSEEVVDQVAPVVASLAEKTPAVSTNAKSDDTKKPTSKAIAGTLKTKPSTATASSIKKTSAPKTTTGIAAKPKTGPTKPSSAVSVAEKKPIKMAASAAGVAGARKPPTTSVTSIHKSTTKTTSGTSTVRSVTSTSTAKTSVTSTSTTKTLTAKPMTATRTTTTSTTARKPLSSNVTTTTKSRPVSGTASTATKPTTLGVSATTAAAKPKVTSPRATLTSQLRKTAPGATSAGAKSPTKQTTSSSVTKTASSVVGSRAKTTTSTTTVTTTTKQFIARPAPKTNSSVVGSTTTTNRRLTVGGTANASTTTQATSKTTTSATQRKSSPIKPVAGKTPTKSTTSSIGAKNPIKPAAKSNTQKSAETKSTTQMKSVAGDKELNGNVSPDNDSAVEPQQPTPENTEPIVPNSSEPFIPGEGDGNADQQLQVEISSA